MKKFICLWMLILGHAWATEITPTVRSYQSVTFADDMNFMNLDLAIDRQLKSFATRDMSGDIRFGTKVYSKDVLKESLLLLRQLVLDAKDCLEKKSNDCMDEFNLAVNDGFAIYTPVPNKDDGDVDEIIGVNTTKFTSYYSPDFEGSRTKTAKYNHAIYGLPTRPEDINFSRVDIDYKGALEGKGYELYYVDSSFFEIYLLHVQGGGRIKIKRADGIDEMKYLSYVGGNGLPFQMIYKYMYAHGYLEPDKGGVPEQRRFLTEHPEKQEEIFGSCPSYTYFKESDEEPIGLNDIPLTEGRSLAIDSRIYKTMGMINFVKTIKATHLGPDGKAVKEPFSRFFISQDTGGAIRGNARCDLYSGYGAIAELIAYNMNEMGEQYFLIKK